MPLSAWAAIVEEIHRSGCNTAAYKAQMDPILTDLKQGSQEQKTAYLPEIASGELRLQAFNVTEPTSGAKTTSFRTTGRRNSYKL